MRITVEARPGQKKAEVIPIELADATGSHPGSDGIKTARYKVYIDQPAKENKANLRLLEIVAEHFQVPLSCVRFVSGVKAKNKVLEIDK